MSQMIEVKVAELVGAALDWAVAMAEGLKIYIADPEYGTGYRVCVELGLFTKRYRPSTDWEWGGPLIEKYHIQTSYNGNHFSRSPTREYWCAYVCKPSGQEEKPSGGGPTALIAVCRAIVAAKSGDVVSVPAELMEVA